MKNAEEQMFISALNYLRNNQKVSENEMRERFGSEGVFVLHTFWARFADARKLKDGRPTRKKRDDVISQMGEDFKSGRLKNPVRDYNRRKQFLNIFIIVGAIVSAICVIIFGGAFLLLVPPIWIIIFLLIWIIKKL